MNVPFIDLAWQEAEIREERMRRFQDVIDTTSFVLGPQVKEFETAFADYTETQYAVGVSGGTDALTIAFRALNIGEGDEVITIPTTFMASVSSFMFTGATPLLVDIDPATRAMDLEQLEAAITPRTKAILAVHLYGLLADMDAIQQIADKHSLLVIEDAAQAHGARYKGRRAGSMSAAAAFSFFPAKNLGAYGDGGALVTSREDVAIMARALRNQGCITKYDHTYIGYNSRLDSLQAAVLIPKLARLDTWNQLRRDIAQSYLTEFSTLPLKLPVVLSDTESVWHLFVVEVPEGERERFMGFLSERGIASGMHYPIALHRTPALAHLNYAEGAFPHAERLAANCVSLPLYPGMKAEQVDAVISAVRAYFHG
jgi:dTDP-4-amino-4,6-dideoxygalactose transaminase